MSGRKYIGPFASQPVGSMADVSRHGLVAAVGATVLLGAVATEGLYRVSLSHSVNVAGGAGSMQLIIKAFQEGGPVAASTFALPSVLIADAAGLQSGAFTFTSDGSADITYEVDFTAGTAGSLQYSLRVVLEQLSTTP